MEQSIDTNEDLLDTITFDKFITELTGLSYSDFQNQFGHFQERESNKEGDLI